MEEQYTEIIGKLNQVKIGRVYAYFSLLLSKTEMEEFKLLSEQEQQDYLYESGDFIMDEYNVKDYGEITEIIIR